MVDNWFWKMTHEPMMIFLDLIFLPIKNKVIFVTVHSAVRLREYLEDHRKKVRDFDPMLIPFHNSS